MERSAGVVLFRPISKGSLFLLLHYPSGHWDFVKGHKEPGETARQTAVRESGEETGITDMDFVKGFRQNIRYSYSYNGHLIRKQVTFFLARTKTSNVRLSDEHLDFVWTDYKHSMKRVTFRNARKLLYRANRYLAIHNVC